ncbi:YqjK-like family protein [Salinicola avicenniae]|uniref:YqjK-like family protein n=1 Tax=Salinicola avicenniae TaxID=2916836 RepID=UPI002072E5FA|nr:MULTISPECIES: YqjK-like family protein [unclassified Salinicola]
MSERSRQQQIEDLETEILQQRLEMTAAMREWHDATAPIDNAWHKLTQWRVPLMAVGGLFAMRGARRPRSTGRLLRRTLTGLMMYNRGKALYRATRGRNR